MKKSKTPPITYDNVPCDLGCGQHYGLGCWTAEVRARKYAWKRDMNLRLDDAEYRFLMSYQRKHGAVKSTTRGV